MLKTETLLFDTGESSPETVEVGLTLEGVSLLDAFNHRGHFHFATTCKGTLLVWSELGPTMMSKTPGSTTQCISRFSI